MTFAYYRSLTPIIGVLLALALIEAMVAHLVVIAYWGRTAAIVVGVADLSLFGALVGLLRSFRRAPISLADGVLTMRTGFRLTMPIDIANVSGFRAQWNAEELRRPDVLNMALATWPNVMLELSQPVLRRRRQIAAIAHCVDDPATFRRTVLGAAEAARSGTIR